jgi:hypothetical protein
MSYDIFAQNLPAGIKRAADIPDDFEPGSIGSRADVIEKMKATFPGLTLERDGSGSIEGEGYSIEIDVGEENPVESVAFYCRGGGMAILEVNRALAALGVGAMSTGKSGIFNVEAALKDFGEWEKYRDQVSGKKR